MLMTEEHKCPECGEQLVIRVMGLVVNIIGYYPSGSKSEVDESHRKAYKKGTTEGYLCCSKCSYAKRI